MINVLVALAFVLCSAVATARDDRFEPVRDLIRTQMQEAGTPSMAVAISHRGNIVWEAGFGWANKEQRRPATEHTMYSLASISKPITATGLMTLVEAGEIDLNAPINDYLGAARLRNRIDPAKGATVRQVANHTSGLPTHYQFFFEDEPVPVPSMDETILRHGELMRLPGERFEYSNLGYGVIDQVVSRVSGQSFPAFMRQRVFIPLGLTHMSVGMEPALEAFEAIRYDASGAPIANYRTDHPGASDIYASAHDLLRFAMFHLKARLRDQKAILSNASIDAMQRLSVANGDRQEYGIGWFVRDRTDGYRVVDHGGSMPGVSTVLMLIPSEQIAVVVLTNGGQSIHRAVADAMIRVLLPKWTPPARAERREPAPFSPSPDLLGAWKGTLQTHDSQLPVTMEFLPDGQVRVAVGGQLQALVHRPSYRNEEFRGEIIGVGHTGDARRPASQMALRLRPRGTTLTGGVTAFSDGLRSVATTAWVELTRVSADENAVVSDAVATAQRHFDILIRGGTLVDGNGGPRYRADIGIRGDEIAAIGRLAGASARRTVEAAGRVVTPGFIDMHSHLADGTEPTGLLSADPKHRAAQNFVAQAITTGVTNQDGYQSLPLREQRRRLEEGGIGLNVILLNGHSGLRREVMEGGVDRAANALEITRMQDLLRRDLADGLSFGMSLGVEYTGARHASTEEQLALGEVLAAYNGIFIPHLRSQGIAPMWYQPSVDKHLVPPTLDDSIDETLRVAEESGAIVVFTHMKARGPGYRGEAARIVQRLEAARARGARVYMDVYPYDSAESDNNFSAVPSWIFGEVASGNDVDYRAAFEAGWARADAARRLDFGRDVRHQIAYRGGIQNIRVLAFPIADYVGKSYAELMKRRGLDEVQLTIALQREGDAHLPGGARMRSFSMDEEDIEAFYRLDWCAVSTDAWIALPEEAVGSLKYQNTHQRLFGSYPRRLAHFSALRRVDTLEHAVRAASALPADILNLRDRGRLAVGMKADVVVLDIERLKDNTTYLEPSVYPSGVDYVLVNGELAVDGGKPTLALKGRVLKPAGSGPRSMH